MKIKRLHPDAILPKYATEGSSAFDLFAYEAVQWEQVKNIDLTSLLYSLQAQGLDLEGLGLERLSSAWVAIIPTGWAFEIPHEHGLFLLSRSGHGFKHLATLANSVGLLDFDYRGQGMVKLICFSDTPPVIKEPEILPNGEVKATAVAQCVLMPTPRVYFCVVDELGETKRGTKGFGSTDK